MNDRQSPQVETFNLDEPGRLAACLRAMSDRLDTADRNVQALDRERYLVGAMLGTVVRLIDKDATRTAISGPLARDLVARIDAISGDCDSAILATMREALTTPDFAPRPPPKGGMHLKIVGGTEWPK